MNRRTFFSRIGSAVVGCYLALNVPTLKEIVNRVPKMVQVPNPDYINATYEAYSEATVNIYGRASYLCKVVRLHEEPNPNAWNPKWAFPLRFNHNPGVKVTRHGEMPIWEDQSIPPLIWKEV